MLGLQQTLVQFETKSSDVPAPPESKSADAKTETKSDTAAAAAGKAAESKSDVKASGDEKSSSSPDSFLSTPDQVLQQFGTAHFDFRPLFTLLYACLVQLLLPQGPLRPPAQLAPLQLLLAVTG
jgi:hypothetical protein